MCRKYKLLALFNMVMWLLWKSQASLWANTLNKNLLEIKESIYCCSYGEVVQHKSGWGTTHLERLN